jgi:RNA polymerase sigma-70 factor (ECF subfamily)
MSVVTAEIYNQFHRELENFILKKVKDKVIAKDILQDVFVKIHLHLHAIKDQTKLTSWIYQLTRNTIYDYYRKLEVVAEEKEIPQEVPDISIHDEQGLEKCVLPFINQLPSKYKEALVFTDIKGMSQIQMAEQLQITYSSAKSRVQRARQKLKVLFTDCCLIQSDVYGNIISYRQHACGKECTKA